MKTWIRQPPGTHLCGQVAVAVVAGITLPESVWFFGHRRATRTRDIIRVLRLLGLASPERLVRCRERPALAIAKLRRPQGRGWHWVVVEGDEYVWDGVYGSPDGTAAWPEGCGITSYLPIG